MTSPTWSFDPVLLQAFEASRAGRMVDQQQSRRLRGIAALGGALVSGLGIAVLVGWVLSIEALTRVAPTMVAMKVMTALLFVILGFAITAPVIWDSPRIRALSAACGVAIMAWSALILMEYSIGVDLHVDNIGGFETTADSTYPGRMSFIAALLFLLNGLAVTLHKVGRVAFAQGVAFAASLTALLSTIGYLYGFNALYDINAFKLIAIHTAIGSVVASVSILLLSADQGPMSMITSTGPGGFVFRLFAPAAFFIPVFGGYLLILAIGRSHEHAMFPIAAAAMLTTVIGVLVVFWLAYRLAGIDDQRAGAEEAYQVVRAAREATERAATHVALSERRLRQMIRSSGDGFASVKDGRLVEWNPANVGIYGVTREQALGASAAEVVEPTGNFEVAPPSIGDGLRVVETSYRRPDGVEVDVELRMWAVDDEGETVIHTFSRDITERKRAQRELESLNRDLNDFASIAAHDLRQPLTAIRGQAETLIDDGLVTSGIGEELAGRIVATALRGSALIDDLLAYARAGNSASTIEVVDLEKLTRDIANDVVATTPRDASVEVEALPHVEVDPGLVRQVLANLIGNAITYCPADRPALVRVSGSPHATAGMTTLHVDDNGPGIPEDERPHVFEMFRRGTTSAGLKGTGIGLALCRRVVEHHGGRICIEDSPLGGARFTLTLPSAGNV